MEDKIDNIETTEKNEKAFHAPYVEQPHLL